MERYETARIDVTQIDEDVITASGFVICEYDAANELWIVETESGMEVVLGEEMPEICK